MTAAQRGARNRRHGHDTELMVAKYLRARGFVDAKTTRAALGHDGHRAPGDIAGVPGVCLEVKSTTSSSWPSWRKQLLAECPPGDLAVLVRRVRGVTDVGEWDAEIPASPELLSLWLDIKSVHWCQRTGMNWVRVRFGLIVDLLTRR